MLPSPFKVVTGAVTANYMNMHSSVNMLLKQPDLNLMPGEWFKKTKIDFKLDLTMAGRSCH